MTPLAMLVRRLWPDRNPLRRRADRAEFAVLVVLLVAFLAGAPLTALAACQWVAASGLHAERAQAGRHQVTVYAQPGARADAVVMVWVDRSGRLAAVPFEAADVADQMLLAAVTALVALPVVLLILRAYAGIFLDRRRMAAWDADWSVTEPQWTGRR